jgi:hypothetical protein
MSAKMPFELVIVETVLMQTLAKKSNVESIIFAEAHRATPAVELRCLS